MRYALNSSTIRPTPLLKKIQIASQAGYSGIELWHDDLDSHLNSGGSLKDLRKALDDLGLSVPTTIYMAGWFEAAEDQLAAQFEACARKMEQAAVLGAEFIIASPPSGRADNATGAKRYRQLLAMGRKIGVRPSMEFLGFVEQLNTIEQALEVIQLAGDPEGTTILDPFHIFRGGGSMDSILLLQTKQIAVSHFNDTPAFPARESQGDSHRVQPGDGHLDLKRYLRLLKQTGYDGWLSLELFNETLWQANPLDVARDGLERMRTLTAEANLLPKST